MVAVKKNDTRGKRKTGNWKAREKQRDKADGLHLRTYLPLSYKCPGFPLAVPITVILPAPTTSPGDGLHEESPFFWDDLSMLMRRKLRQSGTDEA